MCSRQEVFEMRLHRSAFLSIALVAAICTALAPVAMSKKMPPPAGDVLFKQNCSECHVGGGNIIKPNKPVCESQKLASLATFKAYLKSPLGHMPYYKHIVTDPASLKALYQYCKTLKPSKQS